MTKIILAMLITTILSQNVSSGAEPRGKYRIMLVYQSKTTGKWTLINASGGYLNKKECNETAAKMMKSFSDPTLFANVSSVCYTREDMEALEGKLPQQKE